MGLHCLPSLSVKKFRIIMVGEYFAFVKNIVADVLYNLAG